LKNRNSMGSTDFHEPEFPFQLIFDPFE